ncbi:MAG: potassium channel family protein [Thermoanaerobaculia bacterium]
MNVFANLLGAAVIVLVLWDAFEAIVLPRRVTRRLRLTRLFYRSTWRPWSFLARRLPPGKLREGMLSSYGPLSLLLLLAVWACGLTTGFAILQWAGHSLEESARRVSFATDLYMSGTTFFTLGLGDVTPHGARARLLTVLESGTGFGFLAVVIGYLPVIYSAFSRRETNITLLDARAGSPPSAQELLKRFAHPDARPSMTRFLRDWELWTAELMESHLSYPVLCYYRSQHDNQSWLAAMTTILDTCAFVAAHGEGEIAWQARMTFAIARHAVVDISQVLNAAPVFGIVDRLPLAELERLREDLRRTGIPLCKEPEGAERLSKFRQLYEPYVHTLAARLLISLPGWTPAARSAHDNWQTSAWEKQSRGSSSSAAAAPDDEHA